MNKAIGARSTRTGYGTALAIIEFPKIFIIKNRNKILIIWERRKGKNGEKGYGKESPKIYLKRELVINEIRRFRNYI